MFELITPLTYWVLVVLWGIILWLYLRARHRAKDSAVAVLLFILAIDALRSLIESSYFGLYFNAQFGLLPSDLQALLGRPELLILPKLVNVAAALLILFLLIRRWLPHEAREKARQRDRLRESEAYNRTLFDSLPLGLVLCTMDGVLVDVNPAFANIIGTTREEALKLSYWDITPQNYAADEQRQLESLEKHGRYGPYEKEYRHRDGHLVPVRLTGVKIVRNGVPHIWSSVEDISAEKRAEAAQNRSERRFRELLKLAPIPLCHAGLDGDVYFANDRFTATFGYTIEDIPTIDDWWPRAYPDPAYRSWVQETWNRLIRTSLETGEDIEPIEYTITCKDGRERIVEVAGITFEEDFLATFIDRTEQEQTLKALQESEQRYRQLYEALTQPMALHEIICDDEGNPVDYRFLDVNPAFEELLGKPRREIVGRTVLELLPGTEPHWIEQYGRVAQAGTPTKFDEYAAELDRYFSVLAYSPCKGQFAVIANDITERVKMLEDQQRLHQQMLQTQKLESLGVLAGGIAHDFNNILMAVLGNVDLARARLTKESPAMAHLKQIESAAVKAADLANQMLAYSGKGKFVVEPLDLSALIEEMSHMLEISISKQAVLRFNLAENLPSIEADATQLRQIILNLVVNASEAIGKRSGVISLSTGVMTCDQAYLDEVWVDSGLDEGMYVYVEIADTGCGIPRDDIPRIFDPFFTTKFTGRGLGMAAVLGIVSGHGGAIKVYSEVGQGTTFKTLLPASERPAVLFDLQETADGWRGEGLVLLVDDEETVRSIGGSMLEELGFSVQTASDGREALEVFQDCREELRFVVMDLTMPHLDGEETYRQMRRIDPEVRVIMTSGYNEQEVTQKFVGKKLAGFLQKPYTLSALSRAVRRLLEQDPS